MGRNNLKNICHFLLAFGVLLLAACSGGSSGNNQNPSSEAITYSTTSSKGDYSEWTFEDNELTATWNFINDAGDIDYSFNIAASCTVADSMGVRECTISSSSCSDGVSACPLPPTGSFNLVEAPGVALFSMTDAGMPDAQLHVGFAKNNDACSDDVTGDYVFIRTALGIRDSFGVYRSDANFINVEHSDFGFVTSDANATQTLSYNTSSETAFLIDSGCNNGVRERIVDGDTIRSMMTDSGLFILDLPAGEGGLVAFKVDKAATLADFANKSFAGISFPDNAAAETFSAEFGALNIDQVEFTATFASSGTSTFDIKNLSTAASLGSPAYPDFTLAPPMYASSNLAATGYPTPDTIPGVFKLDQLDDSGRVILTAMKFNDKVIAVGMVYNYRTTTDVDPSAGDGVTTFSENNLYNTGNFIFFEQ